MSVSRLVTLGVAVLGLVVGPLARRTRLLDDDEDIHPVVVKQNVRGKSAHLGGRDALQESGAAPQIRAVARGRQDLERNLRRVEPRDGR